jgi:phage terminase large subunit-like protein
LITLEEESLIQERCFIFGESDNSYVVYKHLPEAGQIKKLANMNRELNRKHFEVFHECLEKVKGEMCVGYDFTRS